MERAIHHCVKQRKDSRQEKGNHRACCFTTIQKKITPDSYSKCLAIYKRHYQLLIPAPHANPFVQQQTMFKNNPQQSVCGNSICLHLLLDAIFAYKCSVKYIAFSHNTQYKNEELSFIQISYLTRYHVEEKIQNIIFPLQSINSSPFKLQILSVI